MLSVKKLIYKMMEELPTKVITTDTFSSLPHTYSNTKIKAHHVVVDSQLSNPSAQTGDWTVTTANGSMTIAGSISGSTTLTVKLTKSE